jgi:transcriptional regulator with XRE-family HTH domain
MVYMENKLGKYIEQRQKELDLSLRELADRCGLSHSYIDSLKKGIDPRTSKPVSPTIETMDKLAKGLNVTLFQLLVVSGYGQEPNDMEIPPTIEKPPDIWDELDDKERKEAEDFMRWLKSKRGITDENAASGQ